MNRLLTIRNENGQELTCDIDTLTRNTAISHLSWHALADKQTEYVINANNQKYFLVKVHSDDFLDSGNTTNINNSVDNKKLDELKASQEIIEHTKKLIEKQVKNKEENKKLLEEKFRLQAAIKYFKDEIMKHQKNYHFVNEQLNEEFRGTRLAFQTRYEMSPASVNKIISGKPCKNWIVKEELTATYDDLYLTFLLLQDQVTKLEAQLEQTQQTQPTTSAEQPHNTSQSLETAIQTLLNNFRDKSYFQIIVALRNVLKRNKN